MKENKSTSSILGVKVSPLTYKTTIDYIQNAIARKQKGYICVAAVHLIMECQSDASLRRGVNQATFVTPDGMPLVWLLRWYGKKTDRIYGPDLVHHVCAEAIKHKWKLFLLGGKEGASKALATTLRKKYVNLIITDTLDTPVRPLSTKENKSAAARINASGADIVFVGMGCPHQERWMIDNRKRINTPVFIGVGAAFDFISGTKKQAPPWVRQSGLEWFFRLLQEPTRLWYRYIPVNIHFILLLITRLFLKKKTLGAQ